jgi:hypothetical protein
VPELVLVQTAANDPLPLLGSDPSSSESSNCTGGPSSGACGHMHGGAGGDNAEDDEDACRGTGRPIHRPTVKGKAQASQCIGRPIHRWNADRESQCIGGRQLRWPQEDYHDDAPRQTSRCFSGLDRAFHDFAAGWLAGWQAMPQEGKRPRGNRHRGGKHASRKAESGRVSGAHCHRGLEPSRGQDLLLPSRPNFAAEPIARRSRSPGRYERLAPDLPNRRPGEKSRRWVPRIRPEGGWPIMAVAAPVIEQTYTGEGEAATCCNSRSSSNASSSAVLK